MVLLCVPSFERGGRLSAATSAGAGDFAAIMPRNIVECMPVADVALGEASVEPMARACNWHIWRASP
eukprot:254386-Pyramimonas_sp.AAC.1